MAVTVADNHGGVGTRSGLFFFIDTPPVVTPLDGPTPGLVGQLLHYTGAFTDPDPDAWTGTVNFGDGSASQPLTLNQDKTFAFDHAFASGGSYTVTVDVADNFLGSFFSGAIGSRSLIVSITGNGPPHAVADAATLTTGTAVAINVLANDTDPDGDHLTVTTVTQPASRHGKVTINANGTLTYTQTVFVNGAEAFTYTVSDGHGGTATATVTVTVNLPATVGIGMLLDQVKSSGLSQGQQNSLAAKLNAARQALAQGNEQAAANKLAAFENQVRALKLAHTLTDDLAQLWLFEVDNILATMP